MHTHNYGSANGVDKLLNNIHAENESRNARVGQLLKLSAERKRWNVIVTSDALVANAKALIFEMRTDTERTENPTKSVFNWSS